MAEGLTNTDAKRRAAIARKARLKQEAGQHATPEQPREDAPATAKPRKKAAQQQDAAERDQTGDERVIVTKRGSIKADAADGIPASEFFGQGTPDAIKNAKVYMTPRGPVIARPERPKGEQARAADQRKQDQQHEAEQKRADALKAAEAKKADQKREADRKAQQKQDAERKAAEKEAAQKRDDARKAAQYIAEQHRRQLADQQAEHSRLIREMRLRHRGETKSHRSNEDTAEVRHWHQIKATDNAEHEALKTFDAKRGGAAGWIAEKAKGKAHYDAERQKLVDRFEAERMKKHRDYEALKERQFTAAQNTRIRQGQDRRRFFEGIRADRLDLKQQQDTLRPGQVEERTATLAKTRERPEQGHARPQGHERGHSHEFKPG